MDPLTLFGLFAVGAMLVFYALEERSPLFIAASPPPACWRPFAGFFQVRPFGVVELVWSVVALRRWLRTARRGPVET